MRLLDILCKLLQGKMLSLARKPATLAQPHPTHTHMRGIVSYPKPAHTAPTLSLLKSLKTSTLEPLLKQISAFEFSLISNTDLTKMSVMYRPLDDSREEIRLLELLPSLEHGSHLRCRVKHASIKDAKYQALSYAWGDQTDREDLEGEYEYQDLFSGQRSREVFRTTVGRSLASALRHLRDKNLVLTLWADAICIDQGNNDEKSVQVKLMATIYKTASEVIVWLGPAGEGSDDAMEALAEVGKDAEQFYFENSVSHIFRKLSQPSTWEVDDPVDDRGLSMKPFLERISGQSSGSGQGIFPPAALEALTKRLWWSRVWVLQEMFLASTVIFACGNHRLPETQFRLAILSFFGFYHIIALKDPLRNTNTTEYQQSVSESNASGQSMWMLQMRGIVQKESLSLFGLAVDLYDSRGDFNFMATDPRDKIYGILGIVDDALQPNYNYTCGDVYTEAMMAILRSGEMLALSYCLPQLHNIKLPSWVIDWTSEFGTPFNNGTTFTSAGETQPFVNFEIEAGVLTKAVMFIQGCRVSIISYKESSWTDFRATRFERTDELTVTLAEKENYAGSDVTALKKLSQLLLEHQAASDWIAELRKAVTDSSSYDALGHDPVLNIILCGDTTLNDRLDGLRRGFRLLEGTDLADFEMWLKDLRSIGDICHIIQQLQKKAKNFCFFISATGHVGYAPDEIKENDIVVIFFGAPTPFVIRPLENNRYRFIGPAYVEGIMMGEFMKGEYVGETFILE